MDMSCFAANVQALKRNLGLSLSDFAAECDDLSYSSLNSYIYSGVTPPLPAILKICNAHKVSPNTLLSGMFTPTFELDHLRQIEDAITRSSGRESLLNFLANTKPSLVGADFGARLRIIRTEAGYSVNNFAKMCSVVRTTLAGIEANQRYPGLEVFLSICKNLELSPEYLLAPSLTFSTFSNPKMLYLTPRQISFFLKIAPDIIEQET